MYAYFPEENATKRERIRDFEKMIAFVQVIV